MEFNCFYWKSIKDEKDEKLFAFWLEKKTGHSFVSYLACFIYILGGTVDILLKNFGFILAIVGKINSTIAFETEIMQSSQ